jgi:hypothetical protein
VEFLDAQLDRLDDLIVPLVTPARPACSPCTASARMSSHPATRAYVERRTKEGLSKKEIIRCLKRYVAREVYHQLRTGA